MEHPLPRERLLVAAGNVAVALWGLRWWLGAASRHGDDTAGHLQRIEAAWALFTHGRLDGWFDGAMLGYQLHLFYGPGLAVASGVVKILSLGRASSEICLAVVLVVALMAVPWALARLGRALGLGWWSASTAGVLGLVMSSPRGGGIQGGFDTALAAQQLAVPMVLVALAMTVELVSTQPDRTSPPGQMSATDSMPGVDPVRLPDPTMPQRSQLQLGGVLMSIAMTHPLSLVMTMMFTPLVLGVAWISGDARPRNLRRLVPAGGWFVGLSALWWVPMVDRRDLRGPVTSWDLPGVVEHVRMFVTGNRGTASPFGVIVVVAVMVAIITGVVARQQRLLVLGLLPPITFGLLHGAHGLIGVDHPVGMQFPNRGLVYVGLLSTPVVALVVTMLAASLSALVSSPLAAVPTQGLSRSAAVIAWLCTVGLVTATIGHLQPSGFTQRRVDPRLTETADVLAAEMEPGARFVFIAGPGSFGVPQPQRWLAWRSGRSGLASFGPEYAPGSGLAMALSDKPRVPAEALGDATLAGAPSRGTAPADAAPGDAVLAEWFESLRGAAVSHVVVADPEFNRRLGATDRDAEELSVWRLPDMTGGPAGSIVPVAGARTIHTDPGSHMVEAASDVHVAGLRTALGWSPGWTLQVDGIGVSTWRSRDGTVAFDLPAGTHELRFDFSESPAGPLGRAVTVLTVMIAVVRRRRWNLLDRGTSWSGDQPCHGGIRGIMETMEPLRPRWD